MKRTLILLALVVALLLTGCDKTESVSDAAAVEAVIAELFAAIKTEDGDRVRALLVGEHFSPDQTPALLLDYSTMPGDLPAVLLDSMTYMIRAVAVDGDEAKADIYIEYFDPYLFMGRLLTYLTERMESDPDMPTDEEALIDYLLAIDDIRRENMSADDFTCYFRRTDDGWKVDLDRLFADYYEALS